MAVTNAQVEAMVADFNQSGGRVPLVPGHPSDDNPALGYATKLGLSNGRAIVTEVDELNPAFMAIVNSGELNRVSVKLGLPSGSRGHQLKHIGFLGRSRPALDQLKSAQFSTNDGEIILMADDDRSTEFAEREATFAQREAEFAAREAAFARTQKYEPLVEGWVREGKIAPAQKAPFVALFCALPEGDEATFAAADGTKQSLVEFTKSFVNGLPKQIEYAEISKAEGKTQATASFKAYGKDDGDGDNDEMEMHDKIIASGVDPKDSTAYAAALKKMMKGECK